MSTTLSNEVWRDSKSKALIMNALNFQSPEGILAPLLLVGPWLLTRELVYSFDYFSLFTIYFSFLLFRFVLSLSCL